jgi:uncharacterized protein YbbC (DUF1343 family)
MYREVFNAIVLAARGAALKSTFIVLGVFAGIQVLFAQSIGVIPGAERTTEYFPQLKGKNVAVVANQTSNVGKRHLVDTLLAAGIAVKKVFAPEHGFRGEADAGQKLKDGLDPMTRLPVVSLYGKNLKPTPEQLKDIDVVIFDVQDVGVRFYTYISTLAYVMEACAQTGVALLVLDRPNPNGHYVDGPVMQKGYTSFVGMHPVPIVHGMTVAEYARMVNGEGWLPDAARCDLTWVPVANYTHATRYDLPVRPSPNLPNMRAVWLYPSICLFEGTIVSEGRGTSKPFQIFGFPGMKDGATPFTPKAMKGAQNPKFKDMKCNGVDLSTTPDTVFLRSGRVDLSYLISAYKGYTGKDPFFDTGFFDKLAGGNDLRDLIEAGWSEQQIRATWQSGLRRFAEVRARYLIYE